MNKIVAVAALTIAAQSRTVASCMKPELEADFDLDAYLGDWYEQYRDLTIPYEPNGDCVTAHYSLTGDDTWPVEVLNVYTDLS